jgi:hypothetical protein
VAALGLAISVVSVIPALESSASASGGGPGQVVSATVSPSWQTNDIVWAIASAKGVVYVGGQFTSVRPPGQPLGSSETVNQAYLAAFNASSGALITSFAPTFTGISGCKDGNGVGPCGVGSLAVSPDGNTLYVGGTFGSVDGVYRDHIAALNISGGLSTTGALVSAWKPTATGAVLSIAPSPDGTTVYLGGDFAKVDGVARKFAGAVTAAGAGTVTTWAPQLNATVTSVAEAPDESSVLVGGDFTEINGVTQQAIGSTDPTTGLSGAWTAPPNLVPNYPGCLSQVKQIVISTEGTTSKSGVAYVAAEGTGGGCFDGDFAVNVSDGSLVWQNACLGATQAIAVLNGYLYKGSHAHDCAFAPGGFPQTNPEILHHLLAQSLTDGSLGHWTPNTDNDSLGPRYFATDGTQLFVGGGFATVNGLPQQGFARFEPTPDTTVPPKPAAPTVSSTQSGVVSLSFKAVSDPDDGTLSYAIYRHGTASPIATLQATSWPWALPVLRYNDTGRTPGKSYTYQVTASDGTNISAKSSASASVTVSGTNPTLSYDATVLGDSPSFFWPLNDASTSTTAQDLSPNLFTGTYETAGAEPGAVPTGPIAGDTTDTATAFDGSTGFISSTNQVSDPGAFSIEGWFRTTSNTGGMLIGFGDNQTGFSSNYDRHIYMMNDGQLVFGVWTGQPDVIETSSPYNDGQWHYVVATQDPTLGMTLYVDGQLIGTNSTTTAQGYNGYWKIGGDNLNGWNLDPWGGNSQGTTEPNSYYFNGAIADVAVYPYALTAAQVTTHYAAANYPGLNG